MSKYQATCRVDLEQLTLRLQGVAFDRLPSLIDDVVESNLFICDGHTTYAIHLVKSGGHQSARYWRFLAAISPEEVERFREAIVDHILNGKDLYDPNSAGGFSQFEIDQFEKILSRYN